MWTRRSVSLNLGGASVATLQGKADSAVLEAGGSSRLGLAELVIGEAKVKLSGIVPGDRRRAQEPEVRPILRLPARVSGRPRRPHRDESEGSDDPSPALSPIGRDPSTARSAS